MGCSIAYQLAKRGFGKSSCVSVMMAELIMTGKCEGPDISNYRLARFDEGKLMQSVFGTGFQD